jgi:hypothetical protein
MKPDAALEPTNDFRKLLGLIVPGLDSGMALAASPREGIFDGNSKAFVYARKSLPYHK